MKSYVGLKIMILFSLFFICSNYVHSQSCSLPTKEQLKDLSALTGTWEGKGTAKGGNIPITINFEKEAGGTIAVVGEKKYKGEVHPCSPGKFHFVIEENKGDFFRYTAFLENNNLRGIYSPGEMASSLDNFTFNLKRKV